jgi:hypothetical protein
MRNLFLILVLVNLTFAAWNAWFAAPERRVVVKDSGNVKSITLVSELPESAQSARPRGEPLPDPTAQAASNEDRPAAPAQEASHAQPSVPAAKEAPEEDDRRAATERAADAGSRPERCISVGPFLEQSQAVDAVSELRGAGFANPTQRSAEEDVWGGYWVHLPGIPSRAEAAKTLAALKAGGISEAYSMAGDDGYTISLGVFSEAARADRRTQEARDLGYEPTVSDSTRRAEVYWVDVAVGPGQDLDIRSLQTQGRINRLEAKSCEEKRS